MITRATIRLAPLPERSDYRAYLLPSFEAGVEAAREMLQAGLRPAVLRLSDEPESEATALMQAGAEGMTMSLFILGFDGDGGRSALCLAARRADPRRDTAGKSLGAGPGEAWRRSRFEAPYLRDLLLDRAIMVDTLETATTWSNYLTLYRSVQRRDAGRDGRPRHRDGPPFARLHARRVRLLHFPGAPAQRARSWSSGRR